MLDQFWSSLKSGTDIRGVASEGGGYEINLTDDVVKRICKGFAIWLEQKFHMSSDCLVVAVGHDSRISAGRISNAAMTALSETGLWIGFYSFYVFCNRGIWMSRRN